MTEVNQGGLGIGYWVRNDTQMNGCQWWTTHGRVDDQGISRLHMCGDGGSMKIRDNNVPWSSQSQLRNDGGPILGRRG